MDTIKDGAELGPETISGESTSLALPTIADLRAEQQKRVPASSWPNYKVALNKFMEATGLNDASQLVPDLTVGFRDHLRILIKENPVELAPSTLTSMKSRLLAWHQTATELAEAAGQPDTGPFAAYLKSLIAMTGKSRSLIAKAAGMPEGTLTEWCTGRSGPSPYGKHKQRVMAYLKRLDLVFGLPQGTLLTRLAGQPRIDAVAKRRALPPSAVSDTRRLNAVPFLARELPGEIEDVLGRHYRFKTHYIPGQTGDGRPMRRSKRGVWRTLGEECPTAQIFRETIAAFFGWLMLPETKEEAAEYVRQNTTYHLTPEEIEKLAPSYVGKGKAPGELDFCQLTDPYLISDFLAWRTRRSGGESGLHSRVLGMVCTLTKPEVGFLWQYPEAAWTYMGWEPIDGRQPSERAKYQARLKEWQTVCAERHTTLAEMSARFNKDQKLRSPRAILRAIVEHHAHSGEGAQWFRREGVHRFRSMASR